MEEKREQLKKVSPKPNAQKPKPKTKKVNSKKEYEVISVKQSSIILSLKGVNTKVAKTKELEGLKVGDRVKL